MSVRLTKSSFALRVCVNAWLVRRSLLLRDPIIHAACSRRIQWSACVRVVAHAQANRHDSEAACDATFGCLRKQGQSRATHRLRSHEITHPCEPIRLWLRGPMGNLVCPRGHAQQADAPAGTRLMAKLEVWMNKKKYVPLFTGPRK